MVEISALGCVACDCWPLISRHTFLTFIWAGVLGSVIYACLSISSHVPQSHAQPAVKDWPPFVLSDHVVLQVGLSADIDRALEALSKRVSHEVRMQQKLAVLQGTLEPLIAVNVSCD